MLRTNLHDQYAGNFFSVHCIKKCCSACVTAIYAAGTCALIIENCGQREKIQALF